MLASDDAAEIADRFALGDDAALTGTVARGEQGEVWRLTTTSGRWAVKVLFERALELDVRAEALYQDAVHPAGIPTPEIVRTRCGDVLAEVGDVQVRVFGWIDLLAPDPMLDPGAVGFVVASIHQIRRIDGQPLDPWYTDPVGAERWDELIARSRTAGAPFADRLAVARDELVALEGLLEAPAELQTCHRDLWADNLRPTASGGLCVLDWTDCGLADPSQELALVLYEFGGADRQRARSLYDAYAAAGGPGRVDRPQRFSMVIAQLGHIGERACAQWLDPTATDVERVRNAARVDEFVSDRPLSRDLIEALLDAVG